MKVGWQEGGGTCIMHVVRTISSFQRIYLSKMNLWIDGWIDEWIDGWMDRQIDGQMDGWMDRQMDRQIDGQMDGWMDGQIDEWIDEWMDKIYAYDVYEWTDRLTCFFI